MARFQQPLSTKRLTAEQATSVLTLRSEGVTDDAAVLTLVAALIVHGARPSTIVRLTGLPSVVVRRLYSREHGHTVHGRVFSSLARVISQREVHVAGSLFLRFFAGIHHYERTLDARSLVEAYRLYADAARPNIDLVFDAALYLAEAYLAGEVSMHTCNHCSVRYMLAATPYQIRRAAPTRGVCPGCRTPPRKG